MVELKKRNGEEEVSLLESQRIELGLKHQDTSDVELQILTTKLNNVLEDENSSYDERTAAQAAFNAGIAQMRQDDLDMEQRVTDAKFSIARDGVEGLSALGAIFINDAKKQREFQKTMARLEASLSK